MNTITDHFNAAKRRIINALEAATPTTTHIDSINAVIDKYNIGLRWIVFDIERFNNAATNNKFTSPDKYNAAFTSIINRLDAIMPTTQPANMVKAAHTTTATKGA